MACITKRRGRYVIDFYDNQGKRKRQTLKTGTTKKAARDKLREIEDQLSRGIYIPDKKIPTFKEVAQDWLSYKWNNVRETTWKGYNGHLKHHFHSLDSIKINRITIANVEKFISEKQKQGMNISTLRKVLITFNQVMSYAVRHRYIDYNPVRDAEKPKGQGGEEKPKIRILTPNEITSLLDATTDQKYRTLFKLAIMSGARQGELLGLKWIDVDWYNNQIHIQRTYNHSKWYKPKSKTSNRKIDLGPSMMTELKKWKLACPKNDNGLIFPGKGDNPIDQSNMLKKHFFPAVKKINIGKMRFHDVRHTYASLLIEQGENIKYIQSQLGHSSPTVTLDVYAHLMRPYNQEAARRIENSVFGSTGHNLVTNTKKRVTQKGITP